MNGHGISRGLKMNIFVKIFVKFNVVKFEFTKIIALHLVLNILEKFDFIQILIKYLIMFTEDIALVFTSFFL